MLIFYDTVTLSWTLGSFSSTVSAVMENMPSHRHWSCKVLRFGYYLFQTIQIGDMNCFLHNVCN